MEQASFANTEQRRPAAGSFRKILAVAAAAAVLLAAILLITTGGNKASPATRTILYNSNGQVVTRPATLVYSYSPDGRVTAATCKRPNGQVNHATGAGQIANLAHNC